MTQKKIISGLLIGAAAGAVIGLLFATDKGKEFRSKLAEKGSDLGDMVKSKVGDLGNYVKDEFGNIISGAKSTAEKKVNEGRDYAGKSIMS